MDNYSPFCTKVRLALRYLGLPFVSRHGLPNSFRALNPAGQVPVLIIDGAPIADSSVILRALDERSGGRLLPGDPRVRSEVLLWEELADTSLYGFVLTSRWVDDENWSRLKAAFFAKIPFPFGGLIAGRVRSQVLASIRGRDYARHGLARCYQRLHEQLDQLDALAPAQGFWVTDEPSIADLALAAQLQSLRCALTPAQAAAVDSRPNLSRYLQRVSAAIEAGVPGRGAQLAG